jgi:hypothetical protein
LANRTDEADDVPEMRRERVNRGSALDELNFMYPAGRRIRILLFEAPFGHWRSFCIYYD